MPNQMQDKVCVITGGAGSIGAAAAKLFLQEGAKVMISDVERGRAEENRRRRPAPTRRGLPGCAADVTKSDQVKNASRARSQSFGKIDVLFSNAGNFGTVAPITEYPEDVFDSVLAVHVKGAFLCAKHAVPQMNDGGSHHHHLERRRRDRRSRRLRLHHRQARPGRPDARAGQGTRRRATSGSTRCIRARSTMSSS